MIAVFALILAGGIIKVYYFRSSFVKPAQMQIDYAKKIAAEKLQSMEINASAFQIQTGKRMRALKENGVSRTVMQVSFYNNSTTHAYLIDVNSGEVLWHSEIDIYIPFGEHKKSCYSEEKYKESNPQSK